MIKILKRKLKLKFNTINSNKMYRSILSTKIKIYSQQKYTLLNQKSFHFVNSKSFSNNTKNNIKIDLSSYRPKNWKMIDMKLQGECNYIYNSKSYKFEEDMKKLTRNDLIKLVESYSTSDLPLEYINEPSLEKAANDVLHMFDYCCKKNLLEMVKIMTKKYPQLLTNQEYLKHGMMLAILVTLLMLLNIWEDMRVKKYYNHYICGMVLEVI